MPLIELESASFSYEGQDRPALDRVSLAIGEGEYVALVGPNGSGKSSLLRLMAGLRRPSSGSVRVAGLDASAAANARALRSVLGLVFQSPADQIVSTVAEEDVAFGPENLGLPRAEIGRRVDAALAAVGLEAERRRSPRFLSPGQQQRLAIAGALAMEGRFIGFDEATAMLDPAGRASILAAMDGLSARGVGLLHVTHDLEEAARADRVLALDRGRLAFDGSPAELLRAAPGLGLSLPPSAAIARACGLEPEPGEGAASLAGRIRRSMKSRNASSSAAPAAGAAPRRLGPEPAFRVEEASFSYLAGGADGRPALDGATLSLPRGASVALVGRTGSGKSSLLQLLDALAFPSAGRVLSLGVDTLSREADLRALRTRAPLSIQRPESALFEFYAGDDVAYGPRNLGLAGKELAARVRAAMDSVGLPYEEFRDRPSRSLSGGEARRLALAGVLALEPEALLLDEPTSSLDPAAREAVLALVETQRSSGRTLAFATHSMEEAASADLVAVLAAGRVAACAPPRELFYEAYDEAWGLARPYACELALALGGRVLEARPLNAAEVAAALRAGGGRA
ncbi:MAG TPA: energy-coupling factor transporter ATPase [Spirochaetales bacterium]|nr:energy-coupling factor transporter ATPase [Spirochaetales bacterium]HRY54951.1 energy-coupling factor transporter ATPase [Spirochaetia bacterium]